MAERIDVFISSTSRDLPQHRKEALDACLRMGMFPIAMEQLPASDADAISVSISMCDNAEIYLGIFAHRYGYVPEGQDISITEMEYNRAVERGIPRLIFAMHEDHPIKGSDVDKGISTVKLETFKNKFLKDNIVNFFKSPEDLRAQVIHSLVPYRSSDTGNLHSPYASEIPLPPEPYVAHPYTLLQTDDLVGRKRELEALSIWAKSKKSVFNFIVAIGGMGKSALTWKWMRDIAPEVMPDLAGRIWWSFYETDARFENFITRTLVYVSGQPPYQIEKLSLAEQEMKLLSLLNQANYLIVLDGLERMMVAYARMDSAVMSDEELDESTANYVEDIPSQSTEETFLSKMSLRKTIDPRIGNFLRKLTQISKSKILISSRLYPAELQTITGKPIPGTEVQLLKGLKDSDAVDLWRSFGISGSEESIITLLNSFENYPLLIRALAGEVSHYRRSPGDFDIWREDHPDFDPFKLPAIQVKSHVLKFALHGLDENHRATLHTISAFRMPCSYDTLVALLVDSTNTFTSEFELDTALGNLENRGLVGWDKRSNRYDVHPIIRGIVWNALVQKDKEVIYKNIQSHFEALPIPRRNNINSYEDLATLVELFNSLIGLNRYDDAHKIYQDHLYFPILHKFGLSQKRIELVETFFPDGIDEMPVLSDKKKQLSLMNDLGFSLRYNGQPGQAIKLLKKVIEIDTNNKSSIVAMRNLAGTYLESGKVRASAIVSRKVFQIYLERNDLFRQAITMNSLGLELGVRGVTDLSIAVLSKVVAVFQELNKPILEAYANCYLSQVLLWSGQFREALSSADAANKLARKVNSEHDLIRSTRLLGSSLISIGDSEDGQKLLHEALIRSRSVSLVEEEIPSLVALANYYVLVNDFKLAKTYLADVEELCMRGPFPIYFTDALLVQSSLEVELNNINIAHDLLIRAYEMAWCDGPPFAYHWGLEKAQLILDQHVIPAPNLSLVADESDTSVPQIDFEAWINS